MLFFWILSKLPPPSLQFGQIVKLFSEVKIQDLKVSFELKRAIYCPQGSGTLRQQLLMMH